MLFVPLYGAILYSYRGQGYQAVGKVILWALPVFLTTLFSINISMMIVMLLSLGLTMAIAVYKRWFQVLRKLILSSLGGFAITVPVTIACAINFWGTEYQKMRVASWLHPFQVDQEHSYGRFTLDFVANNQWIGRNQLLNAEEWSSKLPEGNDYTLAYIASYYGILHHEKEGGGVPFCPHADATDGKLSICLVKGMSKWKLLLAVALVNIKKHFLFREITEHTCESMTVKTENPQWFHMDGEPPCKITEASWRCKSGLRFLM